MEFSNYLSPMKKDSCRTCLSQSEEIFMNVQDLLKYETNNIKLIDILVFLNCVQNNDEENWPQGMCFTCVSNALIAYNFKLNCLKANSTLSQILTIQASSISLDRTEDLNNINLNVVYQDHEYDVPLFNNQPLEFGYRFNPKEVTPLPPVTELKSTSKPLIKEGDKKYSCSICSKSFTKLYNLRYHMAKHTDMKKHLCAKCGKKFHTPNGLRQHLIIHGQSPQFKCGFCNKTYKSRQSLKEHFRVAHSNNKKLFSCTTCDKKFTAKSTLTTHLKSHSGQKFPCPYCIKTYTRAVYLKVHVMTHTGQERAKPFKCQQDGCNRTFTTKNSLTIHKAHVHTLERPHQCGVCSKSFATSSALKVHKECHSNKELFCPICHKKLANRRILQKHTKEHDVDANDMVLETVVDDFFFDHVYF